VKTSRKVKPRQKTILLRQGYGGRRKAQDKSENKEKGESKKAKVTRGRRASGDRKNWPETGRK